MPPPGKREHVEIPIVAGFGPAATVEAFDSSRVQIARPLCRYYAVCSRPVRTAGGAHQPASSRSSISSTTESYLVVPTGEPTRDLMVMAREGRTTCSAGLFKKRWQEVMLLTVVHARVERKGTAATW